jgi:hypothetical protein
MSTARHYRAEELIDLARCVVQPRNEEIHQHLATGCQRCSSQVSWLHRVTAITSTDGSYTVPDHVVRNARALFALNRPTALPTLSTVVARLVFDSFRTPAMAGVRSQRLLTRQAMFQAGDYDLDLRMEREPGATQAALVGQIANRANPDERMARLPIVLISGGTIVKTISNEFGEFQISYEPRPPLKLYIPLHNESREIELRLSQLHE